MAKTKKRKTCKNGRDKKGRFLKSIVRRRKRRRRHKRQRRASTSKKCGKKSRLLGLNICAFKKAQKK